MICHDDLRNSNGSSNEDSETFQIGKPIAVFTHNYCPDLNKPISIDFVAPQVNLNIALILRLLHENLVLKGVW